MYIETQRLVIRDFDEKDAAALLEIKYDPQVMEYNPTQIRRERVCLGGGRGGVRLSAGGVVTGLYGCSDGCG
ncbi:MAG: GNAT family N-acetyltransferase [Oscillospiraceae bacterium]|nr:GNAT family N-acetyltransferase [Oscillospiraceae bacterium]